MVPSETTDDERGALVNRLEGHSISAKIQHKLITCMSLRRIERQEEWEVQHGQMRLKEMPLSSHLLTSR